MNLNQDEIKADIRNLSDQDFYFKYIIKSGNWYFSEYQKTPDNELLDKIDSFKEIVSNNFEVSFHSVQIVGSAKLGMSLSPKKPFREFISIANDENEHESDIDVAIVSEKLFSQIWEEIREAKKKEFVPKYTKIVSDIFNGYINDKDFKSLEYMRKRWEEKISKSNIRLQDELLICHPISYRIYRNWEDMEEYQLSGIRQLKEESFNEI